MPMQTVWVEPELYFEHAGVKLFHTYKHDDVDQGVKRYWFTLNQECGVEECGCEEEPCEHVFDARALSTWQPPVQPPYCTGENDTPANHAAWQRYWQEEEVAFKAAMVAAIESGTARQPGTACLLAGGNGSGSDPAGSSLQDVLHGRPRL